MATLEIFTFFFFLFFFLPHTPRATTCGRSKCTADSQPIRFPFWLSNLQLSNCGYPGFDLSCNNQTRTILSLPLSRDFIVESINYRHQIISINDPNKCFPRRFLDHDISLRNSPFFYPYGLENYTFLNCSSQDVAASTYAPISCLSSEIYKIIAVPTSLLLPPGNESSMGRCFVISTASVPSLFDPLESVQLRLANLLVFIVDWRVVQIKCFGSSNSLFSGLSRIAKLSTAVGVGIPGFWCLIGLVIRFCDFMNNARGTVHHPTTELSSVSNRPPPIIATGLDGLTIESYTKTQLGESLELPEPKDKTCSICLGEYKPKATLRTIPACNHYFHASCVDERLRLKATCPLCRNPTNDIKLLSGSET